MLLYVGLLNIFLSVVLMSYNWHSNRSTLFLGAMLVITSIYTLGYNWGVSGESRFWLAVFWGNFSPIWYLGGPCLYLYVRGTLEDRFEFRRSDLLHLIPAFVSLVGVIPYWFIPFEQKLELADAMLKDNSVAIQLRPNKIIPVKINLLIRPGLMILYSALSIRMVFQFKARFSHFRSIPMEQWKVIRNWIWTLSGTILAANAFALAISLYFNNYQDMDKHLMDQDLLHQVFFQLLLPHGYVLGLLPIAFLLFPQILFGIPIYRHSGSASPRMTNDNEDIRFWGSPHEQPHTSPNPNYAKGEKPLEDPFKDLGERLLRVMEEQKPYTDPDFSLDDLAELLDVPKHHLYYCFRNILQTKFTQLRMDYRIEHAKKLLTTADLNMVTFESVGKDSGFASKSAFYSSFKVQVGCSPGEFVETWNTFGK
ncbi:MAG: AraC family transcriptional regulator [Chitinophagia bacterium]|nr:AraC family transcriptional regulator [Chitinophagia bacterium]